MRVLAHIHTYNAVQVIERALDAVRRQTRQPDAVIVVDNASTDGTVDGPFPEWVEVVRNPANVGASGAVRTGLAYGLEHGFDWVWILDADSVPDPDALEQLLNLYEGFPLKVQEKTGFLASLYYNDQDGVFHHGAVFTRHWLLPVKPAPNQHYYPCDVTIWSGTLYRLAAIREIGLPPPDYFMDWGDIAYNYRIMKGGYKGFAHCDSVIRHNIGGRSQTWNKGRLGPVPFYEFPPLRCYYTCRNTLYFTLYESAERRLGLILGVGIRLLHMTVNFLLRPWNHREHLFACVRGIWHGVTGNMAARY